MDILEAHSIGANKYITDIWIRYVNVSLIMIDLVRMERNSSFLKSIAEGFPEQYWNLKIGDKQDSEKQETVTALYAMSDAQTQKLSLLISTVAVVCEIRNTGLGRGLIYNVRTSDNYFSKFDEFWIGNRLHKIFKKRDKDEVRNMLTSVTKKVDKDISLPSIIQVDPSDRWVTILLRKIAIIVVSSMTYATVTVYIIDVNNKYKALVDLMALLSLTVFGFLLVALQYSYGNITEAIKKKTDIEHGP
jgi:hypothetical protein